MDQEKIGKFIAEQRKKQNLTQEQLAEKLNVSKNAVSKWERGLNLPNVSIMKDLCGLLNITLNELFAGEKIQEEEYVAKTDENIINAINYTTGKARKQINKVMLIFMAVLTIVIAIVIMFIVDCRRMYENKPVIFSTWGIDYYPPVNLEEEKIQIAIHDYLVEKGDSEPKHYENQKTFVSMKIYLIEEQENSTNVYAWVLKESYYLEDEEVKQDSGSSIPHKFVLEKEKDSYVVVDSRIPRDGSYYVEDMKNIFPFEVRKEMDIVHYDGTIDRLMLDIEKQVKLYFH